MVGGYEKAHVWSPYCFKSSPSCFCNSTNKLIHMFWTYCLHDKIMFIYCLQLLERSYTCGQTRLELERWQGTAPGLGDPHFASGVNQRTLCRHKCSGAGFSTGKGHKETGQNEWPVQAKPTEHSWTLCTLSHLPYISSPAAVRACIKPLFLNLPLFFPGLCWDDFAGEE